MGHAELGPQLLMRKIIHEQGVGCQAMRVGPVDVLAGRAAHSGVWVPPPQIQLDERHADAGNRAMR